MTMLRKLGLIGFVFFVANVLAAMASVVVLFMRGRRQRLLVSGFQCPVCDARLADGARYCMACGSRV